jgi:uncharacterized membrane-anchored protein
LLFWITKVAAMTLGETGGDAVSMSMNLGYLVGTAIFAAVFFFAVTAQIKAKRFHPLLFWTTIIATTTVGTTLADFADRSLGIGYAGGASILFILLMASLAIWYWSLGSVSVYSVKSPKVEMFYWLTIMFSQTLGTALGDWTADSAGLGYPWRSWHLRRAAGISRRTLPLDEHLQNDAFLGGLHLDTTTRRCCRRFSG